MERVGHRALRTLQRSRLASRSLARRRARRMVAIAALALLVPISVALATAPVKGGSYSGKNRSRVGGVALYPITFRVSNDGKKLTKIKFAIFIACGAPPPGIPFETVHNVPITNGKFRFTTGRGGNKITVTGRFLSHRKASGDISATVTIPTLCRVTGRTAWTAHA